MVILIPGATSELRETVPAESLASMVGRSDAARIWSFFFFQAEDGIRDVAVTGVQTCALPILGVRAGAGDVARRLPSARVGGDEPRRARLRQPRAAPERQRVGPLDAEPLPDEIGRASGRERGENSGGGGSLKKKKTEEMM